MQPNHYSSKVATEFRVSFYVSIFLTFNYIPCIEKNRLSESEMYVFDPYKKCIQSNNKTILDQGTPIKTSLVANIRVAYYIINNLFSYHKLKIHNKVIHDHAKKDSGEKL